MLFGSAFGKGSDMDLSMAERRRNERISTAEGKPFVRFKCRRVLPMVIKRTGLRFLVVMYDVQSRSTLQPSDA